MQQIFPIFYKQFGIRKIQQLVFPRLFEVIHFPRSTAYHYLTFDTGHPEIDTSQLYLAQYKNRIMVDYVESLTSTLGNPKRMGAYNIKNHIRPFHQKHTNYKYIHNPALHITDEKTLLVYNYNYLNTAYKYSKNNMTEYYRWYNIENTYWSQIASICDISQREHFISINVPSELPAFSFLTTFSIKLNPTITKIFNTRDKLNILEIFKWIKSSTREKSFLNKIKPEHYSKINFIFGNKNNKYTVLNLNYLYHWIAGVEKDKEFNSVSQFPEVTVQKLFLKFLININSLDVVEEPETEPETAPADNEDQDREETQDEISENNPNHFVSEFKRTDKSAKNKPTIPLSYFSEDKIDKNDSWVDSDDEFANILKDIDTDIDSLEIINKKQLQEKGQVFRNDEIESIEVVDEVEIDVDTLRSKVYGNVTPASVLRNKIDEAADVGIISAADYKKLIKDSAKYGNMPDPFGSSQPVSKKAIVTLEDIKIDDEKKSIVSSENVLDPTINASSLQCYDSDYVKNVYEKDMLMLISDIQKAGIVIQDHEIETQTSALGSIEHHTLTLKPIDGSPCSISFQVPKVDENGVMKVSNNLYSLRKQRIDIPLRKINPTTVALTTYYGKTFVSLSEKKADSSFDYLIRQINKLMISDSPIITEVGPANVFDNTFKAPYVYGALSAQFKSFKILDNTFIFDHREVENFANEVIQKRLEKDGSRICGHTAQMEPIVIDKNNVFYIYRNNALILLGDIYHMLRIDKTSAPVDFCNISVFSKAIPIGVVLAYFMGFRPLLKLLGAKYRIVEGKTRPNLTHNEYVIKFEDISYVFTREQVHVSYILGGFTDFEKIIKLYSSKEFDNKDIYWNLFESRGLTSLYMRELSLMNEMFVDGISKTILEEMGEPTTFQGLIIRSAEMLETYYHPYSQDRDYMRDRGYERIPGAVYSELVRSIRAFRNKNISGRAKIDMSPYQVWTNIMNDQAVKIIEDINPIQNLKEREVVTYVGEGGRSKDAMNKASRAYHESDMGILSEATVDSADVGINAFVSANPNYADLRGLAKKDKELNASNIFSTAAMCAPGATIEDGKRVNFISIQHGHTLSTVGYHQPYVRTGYEYVVPNRTTEMFAYTAKKDGQVLSVNEHGVIIKYNDDELKGVQLGRLHGRAEGSVYPHDVVTPLKPHQTFKKGDVVAYNTGFFEPDFLDRKKVVMKNSLTIKVALVETAQTFEDSSALSSDIINKMTTKSTKVKSVQVKFQQNISDIVKVGQTVMPNDILMILEDEITSSGNFDQEAREALKRLSNQSPRSKYEGIIDRIEVFYNGSKDDMSPSLKAIADKNDQYLESICKATGVPVYTGEVNSDYREGGKRLGLDEAVIRIYITVDTSLGVADKGVFANQMKSVVGEVMDYSIHTETGQVVDGVFSYTSFLKRIVGSPILIGTTTTVLKLAAKKAVKLYRGN
jgi:hypothetical protein